MLTGNINWVAAKEAAHFWHLFIRFPKTNTIYEWNQLVYTNDVAKVSKEIEEIIASHRDRFFDNAEAQGETLMKLVHTNRYITKPVEVDDFMDAISKIENFWINLVKLPDLEK